MEYQIKSKPTIYKGTKYRSRLEARWAAFFDLLGWRFQYEPFDLDGWTPDFIVFGSDNRSILFEVKPFINRDIINEYHARIQIIKTPLTSIILSNDFVDDDYGCVQAGFQLSSTHPDYNDWCPLEVHWKDGQKGINTQYDIGSVYQWYDGLLWNSEAERKNFISESWKVGYKLLIEKWIEAGELTRFHYHG